MSGMRSRFTAIRKARRQRSFLLVGLTGLAVTGVLALSAIVSVLISGFVGGLALGVGIVGVAWLVSRSLHASGRRRPAGRSHTLDCRRSRWDRPLPFNGQPHPPTDRRVRPCPGSRHR